MSSDEWLTVTVPVTSGIRPPTWLVEGRLAYAMLGAGRSSGPPPQRSFVFQPWGDHRRCAAADGTIYVEDFNHEWTAYRDHGVEEAICEFTGIDHGLWRSV